jgi:hypothetical protein
MIKHKKEDAFSNHPIRDLAAILGDYSRIDVNNELCKRQVPK